MSTRLQLRTRVRFNLGEPESGSKQRFNDDSINANLNEAYAQYQLELIDNGEGDLIIVVPINTTVDVASYALPSDWVKTRIIERVTTWGTVPLFRNERYDRPNTSNYGRTGDGYRPTYRFRNRNVIFEPAPAATQTNAFVHEYYALQPDLTADGQSPVAGFIEPWQTMMVLYATIAELENKDAIGGVSDIASFRARLQAAEEKFRSSMQGRSESQDCVEDEDDYDYQPVHRLY